MYKHLQNSELTKNSSKNKAMLLMGDRYIIDHDRLLYRIDIPRNKNLACLKPTPKRLCTPLCFQNDIISYVHNSRGHYAAQSFFHMLACRYYWKTVYGCHRTLQNVIFAIRQKPILLIVLYPYIRYLYQMK